VFGPPEGVVVESPRSARHGLLLLWRCSAVWFFFSLTAGQSRVLLQQFHAPWSKAAYSCCTGRGCHHLDITEGARMKCLNRQRARPGEIPRWICCCRGGVVGLFFSSGQLETAMASAMTLQLCHGISLSRLSSWVVWPITTHAVLAVLRRRHSYWCLGR